MESPVERQKSGTFSRGFGVDGRGGQHGIPGLVRTSSNFINTCKDVPQQVVAHAKKDTLSKSTVTTVGDSDFLYGLYAKCRDNIDELIRTQIVEAEVQSLAFIAWLLFRCAATGSRSF